MHPAKTINHFLKGQFLMQKNPRAPKKNREFTEQEGAKQKCAPRENNKSLLKDTIFNANKLQEPREFTELLIWMDENFPFPTSSTPPTEPT